MKYFVIIFLIITLNLHSQSRFKTTYLPMILMTTSISLNAMGDGYNDMDKKELGHVLNAFSIGSLLAIPITCDINKKKWWVYPLQYTFIRIGSFDYIYNTTRKLPLNYIGNSSLTDKFWQKFGPDYFTRAWFFSMGIIIPIDILKT